MRTGKSEIYSEIQDELLARVAKSAEHLELLRQLGLRSAMVVPIRSQSRVLGAISFIGAESGRRCSQEDLELAEEIGRRAGLALENSSLYKAAQEAAAAHRPSRRHRQRASRSAPRAERHAVCSQPRPRVRVGRALPDQGGKERGLFITKQIVEAHGGRIWVESALGEGSVFLVELPSS